jgi:hypothetical protein
MSPTPRELSAGLFTGSIALLMLGLQPLLLGALADESRLDEAGIGAAATAELLALGLTTGLLAGFVPPTRLKLVNIVGAVSLAGCNIWGCFAAGAWFAASRGAAGIASGLLMWVAVVLITRAVRPERVAGIFLTVQTLAQAGLAAILPLTLMPRMGANGGLATLAAFGLCAALASIWLPSRLAVLAKPEGGHGSLPAGSLIGLGAVFFTMAGVVGLWIFVEQLGATPRIGARAASLAVALALAAQVAGSSVATFLSSRLPPRPILIAAGLLNIGAVAVLGQAIGAPLYLASVLLFGFLWLFAMPFQTRLLIDLDPTRRAAMLLSAAQALGSAAGPIATSAFATKSSLGGALVADAVLFGIGLLGVAATAGKRKSVLF